MPRIEVECFADDVNYYVIRTPGREYPGCVIQGDSLRTLLTSAERALAALDRHDTAEAREELSELADMLRDRLRHYEAVLAAHAIRRPYPTPADPHSR